MKELFQLTNNLEAIKEFDERLTRILDENGSKTFINHEYKLSGKFSDFKADKTVKFADKFPKLIKFLEKTPIIYLLWNPEKRLNKYWRKNGKRLEDEAMEIYSKMNNKELLISIVITENSHQIVDVFNYFTKTFFDFDKVFNSDDPKTLIDEYYLVLKEKDDIDNLALSEYWYQKIIDKTNTDKILLLLLSKMTNEQIVYLANHSKKWEEKLYYYGFLSN